MHQCDIITKILRQETLESPKRLFFIAFTSVDVSAPDKPVNQITVCFLFQHAVILPKMYLYQILRCNYVHSHDKCNLFLVILRMSIYTNRLLLYALQQK